MPEGRLGGPRPLAESNLEIIFRGNQLIENAYVGEAQRRTAVAFADAGYPAEDILIGPENENDSIWVMLETNSMPVSVINRLEKELQSDIRDAGVTGLELSATVIAD